MHNNYGPPPAPQSQQTPILGIISLILGILALVISFIPCFGSIAIFIAIAPIVLGIISISQASKNGGQKGLGIAGLCIGAIALLIGLFWGMILGLIGSSDIERTYRIQQSTNSMNDSINNYYEDESEETEPLFKYTDSIYEEEEKKIQ